MRKSVFLLGFGIAVTPASAFAQPVGGGGPADAGAAVKSASIGTPGAASGDAMTQYLQQKSLNNLPGQKAADAAASKLGPARAAKPDELTAGATVNDKTGIAIAKIEQVDPDGIVVSTGLAKVKVPKEAFGHNKAGLLLDMTKAQFEQVVASANVGH